MKTFIYAIAICLYFYYSVCFAQDANISITSSTQSHSPTIIIRSDYDFEKQISLKVKPDPRFLPSEVFIKKISEIGLYDTRGVRITSGFDIDLQNELVLAYSGGIAEIISTSVSPAGYTITANFKDRSGKFVSPPMDRIALINTAGENLCFTFKDVKKNPPKMAFILLLDRSGSMKDVILDVQTSAQRFLRELPPFAECALASFNSDYTWHTRALKNCNCGDFELKSLEAKGKTDIYTPLLNAYQRLSHHHFKDYQKAVILITDGQIYPDEGMKQTLLSSKQDILTFVYFLGHKDDEQLIGLADAYLQAGTDIKSSLKNYFHSLSSAYGLQKVIEVRPCKGGQS